MNNKIKQMLLLQDKLNLSTSWENWKKGITNKGKIINWRRCMYMEMVEAIDSIPWKHWKNIDWQTDMQNLKVEIVDIWHFLLSEILRLVDLTKAIKIIENSIWTYSFTEKLPVLWNKEENLQLNNYLKVYEDFLRLSLIEEETENYLENITKQFFKCLEVSSMSFDDLYKLYIWKNVLNKFRQDHGYKEWTYKKIWSNWKEDNVTMQSIIEKDDNIDFEILYKKLESEYNK